MIRYLDSLLPGKTTRIGVAVSMGIDSVAALLYLRNRGYNVFPIHYDHNIRPQNDLMKFQFCKLVIDTKLLGKTNQTSSAKTEKTESECRTMRLQFFREVCSEYNISIVVTAHHLDDYVESYLMNCFRGKPEYKAIPLISDFVNYKIVHPFLLTEKKDFQEYIDRLDNGEYRKYVVADETNQVIKGSRRNWIRNVIVPELNKQQIGLKRFCREQIQQQIQRMFEPESSFE